MGLEMILCSGYYSNILLSENTHLLRIIVGRADPLFDGFEFIQSGQSVVNFNLNLAKSAECRQDISHAVIFECSICDLV